MKLQKKQKKKNTLHLKHKIALFAIYLVLFATLSAMVDYYAYDLLNPWIVVIVSVVSAAWATLVHVQSREKTKADELAHELEEII
ncbi:MAG TPA: hypothetical protein ENK68_00230 [Epsilonproteobacteria bacterium]|nr:hypothetical protein [Campylobacterota bacterium]